MVGCQPALALQGAGGNVSKGPPVWEMQTRAQPQTLSALHQKIMVIFAIATAALVRGLHRKKSSSHLPNKLENPSAKLSNQCSARCHSHTTHPHRNPHTHTEITSSSNFWLNMKRISGCTPRAPRQSVSKESHQHNRDRNYHGPPQLCHRSWDKHQPATRADKGEPGDATGPIALPRAMQWANVR